MILSYAEFHLANQSHSGTTIQPHIARNEPDTNRHEKGKSSIFLASATAFVVKYIMYI